MQKERDILESWQLDELDEKFVSSKLSGPQPEHNGDYVTEISEIDLENDANERRIHPVATQIQTTYQPHAVDLKRLVSDKIDRRAEGQKHILRKGYLKKQSKSPLGLLQCCYLVLTRQSLLCFLDQRRTDLVGCIDFQHLSYSLQKQNLKIKLKHHQIGEVAVLQADSVSQSEEWFGDIQKVITMNFGLSKIQIIESKRHIYEGMDVVLEWDFIKMAQTGDILLMRTESNKCALQRFITHSEYDHIAMVVKFADNQLKVFEANPDDGVNLYDWDQYQSSFYCFEKMCFRKLYYQNRSQFESILLNFIKNKIGRKYDLSVFCLLRRHSDVELQQSKGYFCSELVAKAYKQMGLLDTQKRSSNYWPIDFTDRGGLVLKQSAYFGPERIIIQTKHLKGTP